MPKLYRILTEDTDWKNKGTVRRLTDTYFQSYTMFKAEGMWNGVSERTLVIEIQSADTSIRDAVGSLALDIKALNDQEAVLVQELDVVSILY